MKSSQKVKNMAMAALLAAVTGVLAQVIIPLGPVPFTMAVFGVFFMGMMLSPRYALASILVYILLGLVGVPVFAGFSAGPAVLAGPTGGYILGFLATAPITGLMMGDGKLRRLIPAMVLGLLACYVFGTAWFMVVYTRNTGAIGLWTALGWCVFPFILPDAAKMALAALVARRLKPILRK